MAINPPTFDANDDPIVVSPDTDAAAQLIRDKVARVYAAEPDASQELSEAEAVSHRTKHQQFMHELSNSGKDLATIQTEWHQYYIGLPDTEKHEVWQEFYSSQSTFSAQPALAPDNHAQTLVEHKHQAATRTKRPRRTPRTGPKLSQARSAKDVQTAIRSTVSAGGQLKVKHHIQSLFFGLGMGSIVIFIFLFSFFNEIIIAPFIQPSRVEAATPIIIGAGNVTATSTPEVIIPKINVEIPVDYSETSTSEATIENDLESGVVHYPTTVLPGQVGNAAFFGHSSNNLFSPGEYKFAFVLLHELVPGDTFYLTYQSKVYIYKVISKSIVAPSDVSVLGSVPGQQATATLITCDPPGTSLHRLIIVGEQISPVVSSDSAPTVTATTTSVKPVSLPGNGPTLWSRVTANIFGRLLVIALFVGAFWFVFKSTNRVLNRGLKF